MSLYYYDIIYIFILYIYIYLYYFILHKNEMSTGAGAFNCPICSVTQLSAHEPHNTSGYHFLFPSHVCGCLFTMVVCMLMFHVQTYILQMCTHFCNLLFSINKISYHANK